MMKAKVELIISTIVEVVDGGYLRNCVIEEHIEAAKKEAAGWQVGIDKHPGQPHLKEAGFKPVRATIKVNRVILEEEG